MPAPEVDNLYQVAVLWREAGRTQFNEPIVYYPTAIPVRWEEGRKEGLDPQGTVIAFDATVFVDQEIEVGSILWLTPDGTALADAVALAYPTPPTSKLFEVIFHDDVPDIRGEEHQRTCMCKRRTNTLPQLTAGTGSGTGTFIN